MANMEGHRAAVAGACGNGPENWKEKSKKARQGAFLLRSKSLANGANPIPAVCVGTAWHSEGDLPL